MGFGFFGYIFPQGGKDGRHRKPLFHFTEYLAIVPSVFSIPSGVLTSQSSRSILEHITYRDSTAVAKEGVKEGRGIKLEIS